MLRNKQFLLSTKSHHVWLGTLCLFLLSWWITSYTFAAPEAKIWPKWTAHNAQDARTINHSAWEKFLDKYVQTEHASGINLISYAEVSPTDLDALQNYLMQMKQLPISQYNRDVQKAYWINVYNALTVKLVLNHYPVESIKDIKFGFFSFGPWDEKLIQIENEKLSLNDIEHRILRPIWKDNRVHYAVNCASIGCPNLQSEAFTSENTERLLKKGAREYINHPRGAMFEEDELKLSSIYDWFVEDFGDSEQGVLSHLLQYAQGDLSEKLKGYDGSIDYDYDWRLNQP